MLVVMVNLLVVLVVLVVQVNLPVALVVLGNLPSINLTEIHGCNHILHPSHGGANGAGEYAVCW